MKLENKLIQEQNLVLTEEMLTSMKILQMPLHNLLDYIEEEADETPEIEVVYSQNYYRPREKSNSSTYYIENISTEEETFGNYLESQLLDFGMSPEVEETCKFIIHNLDVRGYREMDDDDIMSALGISKSTLNEAINIISELEPVGVGARDFRDCLKIQAAKKYGYDKITKIIIENFLEELADGKYEYISDILHVSVARVQEILANIKTLNPVPARGFAVDNRNNYIVPEAYITIQNNNLVLELNRDAMPKIQLKDGYQKALKDGKKNISKAMNIISCIQKRYETLQGILEIIKDKQKEFFYHGKTHLARLTMEDIADEMGLHISTISRAIQGKYMGTPHGTMSIKSLLVAYDTSIQIKEIISDIIKNEDRKKTVSDEVISQIVSAKMGGRVARRTIAKYREELGIDSSRRRKLSL